MAEEVEDDGFGPYDPNEGHEKCPTCKGRGTVNPLTAPPGMFVVSIADCPMCDGTGEAP